MSDQVVCMGVPVWSSCVSEADGCGSTRMENY